MNRIRELTLTYIVDAGYKEFAWINPGEELESETSEVGF
jgi:hypothetical protein